MILTQEHGRDHDHNPVQSSTRARLGITGVVIAPRVSPAGPVLVAGDDWRPSDRRAAGVIWVAAGLAAWAPVDSVATLVLALYCSTRRELGLSAAPPW